MKGITLILLFFSYLTFGQGKNNTTIKLFDGNSINKTIALNETHKFTLLLEKGQLALIRLTDYTLDLEFLTTTSDGYLVEETETFDGTDIPVFYANKKDNYQIEITTLNNKNKNGKYTISVKIIESENNDKIEVIDQLLSQFYNSSEPGASVSIIDKDKVIYNRSFGLSDINNNVANTSSSVYNLASVSKQFTAFSIALLASQKKLSIDDDIRKYIPELPEYEKTITINNLIHHTGGLYENDFPLALAGYDSQDYTSKERELTFLYRNKQVIFESGERFQYSNTGYTLLGEIIERITKQPFSQWAKENIFNPLQMNNTMIMDNVNLIIKNKSESYSKISNHIYELSTVNYEASGASNVYTSTDDLYKWLDNFNTGKVGGNAVLELIEKKGVLKSGEILEYAFGNFITEYKGVKRISHLGLTNGYRTSIARFPNQKLAVIYLANNGAWNTYDLASEIYAILLSDEVKLKKRTKTENKDNLVPSNETNTDIVNTKIKYKSYEGVYYSDAILTSYKIENSNDKLHINSIKYGEFPIKSIAKDTFSSEKWFFSKIVFFRDNKNNVIGFETYSNRDGTKMYFVKLNFLKK